MGLNEYLKEKGHDDFEGHCGQIEMQQYDLCKYAQDSKIKYILEIGFNAGHSADTFLRCNPNVHVTSFDIGAHKYIKDAKEYIEITYPERHLLVLGNSTFTVNLYADANPTSKFDLIFIDGGHDIETAYADLNNCRRLAHKDTIVIMDDIVFVPGWIADFNVGPNFAWEHNVQHGKIVELSRTAYKPNRGQCVGKYIL